MTTAQSGLAKALARGASGEVIALAELPTADLLASLSDDQKAELAAALPPKASAAKPDPEADPNEDEQDGDPDDEMAASKKKKMPVADGASASDDRIKIVAAAIETDDACKGKAGLALSMLADEDYAGLSGSAMVKLIGKTSTEGASAAVVDPEAAARDEMKAALSDQQNSNIDAAGAPSANGREAPKSAAMWDYATQLNNPGVKLD